MTKSVASKPFVVSAVIYLVTALTLTQVPLFNYLGYEFSALIGLLCGLVAGINTIAWVRRDYLAPEQDSATMYVVSVRAAIAVNVALVLIPLGVMCVNAFFVKNCSLLEGFKFFLLIPVPTAILASVLGGFFFIIFKSKPSAWYVLFLVLYLTYALGVGYFTPQVFIYNHMIGFFPGLTYDEALSVPSTLWIYRLLTGLLSIVVFCISSVIVSKAKREETFAKKIRSFVSVYKDKTVLYVICLSLIIMVGAYSFGGKLGMCSTDNFVREELGSKFETNHFVIFYSKSAIDELRIKWIACEHEFRFDQITKELGIAPAGKITSFIYPSQEEKKRLIGAGGTNISKPWRKEIHINYESLDATLKHELVHAVAADIGIPVLRISLMSGLTEGLAMAVEWNSGSRTLHEYAAGMKTFGMMRDLGDILTVRGFISQASSVSYILCGSFSRFLMDTYGVDKLKEVYTWGGFEKAYGKPLNELQAEWLDFLSTIPVAPGERTAMEYFFKRQSIFQKICARFIANLNAEAWYSYRVKNYHHAVSLFSKSSMLNENKDATSGLVLSYLRLGNYDSVIALSHRALGQNHSGSIMLRLYEGEAHWMKGDLYQAESSYVDLYNAHISTNVDEAVLNRINSLFVRSVESKLQEYFIQDKDEPVRILILKEVLEQYPDFDVGRLMLGQMLYAKKEYRHSLVYLSDMHASFRDTLLEVAKEKAIGIDHFFLMEFPDAKAHFQKALGFVRTKALINEISDWIERCDWITTGKNRNLIL
jgi:tetratricopeptide (TPR) repeat protein